MSKPPNKYVLYETAVQTPKTHAEWMAGAYWELREKQPTLLREDFCGTFAISREWVRLNPKNQAVSIDLDPEPLAFGREQAKKKLKPEQLRRLHVHQEDVRQVQSPAADITIACNFSFFIFKERKNLREYFESARAGLKSDGIFVLEIAGGPGMSSVGRERKTFKRAGKPWFRYVWDQKSFDPLTHDYECAIHFEFPNRPPMKDAFVYHWRLWSVPEVRELLLEAGFTQVITYWEERDTRGALSGVYMQSQSGENDHAWIAYVVGIK